MEISISGGSRNISKTINGKNFTKNNTNNNTNSMKVEIIRGNNEIKRSESSNTNVVSKKDSKKEKEVIVNIEKRVDKNDPTINIASDIKTNSEEKKRTTGNIYKPNKDTTKKKDIIEVKPAIEFHDNETPEDLYNNISQHIAEINVMWGILDESYKNKLKKDLADLIEGMSLGIEKVDIVSTDPLEATLYHINKFVDEFEHVEDSDEYNRVLKDENLMDFINRYYEAKSIPTELKVIQGTDDSKKLELHIRTDLLFETEELELAKEGFSNDIIEMPIEHVSPYIEAATEKIDDDNEIKNGEFKFFRAEVTNANEIKPGEDSKKIIVLRGSNSDLITMGEDHTIIAIDHINDKNINNISIVSKTWLDNMIKRIEDIDGKPVPTNTEDNMVPIPNGVLQENAEESVKIEEENDE